MKTSRMKSFRAFKKEALQHPQIQGEYTRLKPEFELAHALIQKRIDCRLTQTALAKKIGTHQTAIARLESGSYNPTLKQLQKIAKALHAKLVVTIT